MDNIRNLLNEVNTKIKALETAKELYGEQLAPDFLVFDFVNTNETGLSRILACLLNPKGTHGQKTLFLENFIKICLPNIHKHENKIWQNYLANLSKTDVKTEDTTTASQSYRRMDIYLSAKINDESFGICIENKPYASDQQDQLTDYYKELKNRNLTHKHLVYLSEYGEPSEYSVKSNVLDIWQNEKVFSHVTYTQLVEWLKECKKDCQNQSVTEFINQFIKFIQKQFMGVEDMNEQELILEGMMKNSESIASAIKVSLNMYEMKRKLISKLVDELKTYSKELGYLIETANLTGNSKYETIRFIQRNQDFSVDIEFQGTAFNMPAICIIMNDEKKVNSESQKRVFEIFKKSMPDKELKGGEKWYVWYFFEIKNWWSETQAWEMIQEGKMSKEIMIEIKNCYNILKENHLLN